MIEFDDEDIDIGEPFYDESITPAPPTHGTIDRYIIQKNLIDNPTQCSYVYTCTDSLDNQIKVIKFVKFFEKKIERIKNEITTMRMVNHPNIIKLENYFRYGPYLCLILPFTPHRSLLWILVQYYKNGMPEDMAAPLMNQMLKALQHLHNQNIWHRDIKPDNILLFDSNPSSEIIPIDINNTNEQQNTDNTNNQNDNQNHNSNTTNTHDRNNSSIPKSFTSIPKVVLCDFGFAKSFIPGEKSEQYLGTPEYVAPEMVNHIPYDYSVDIWSLGITFFVMLTGRFPFPKKNCFRRISRGLLNYDLLKQMDISEEAQDLFDKMCAFNPEDRITATDALNHPWILSSQKSPIEMDIAAAIGQENQFIFTPGT